jgi:GTP pyrophosphokinase
VEEKAKHIIELIKQNFQFSEEKISLIEKMLENDINYSRAEKIIEFIIRLKLDKSSLLAFINYQLYKVKPDLADEIAKNFDKGAQDMIADFKTIKDINQLTRSEEIEDIKRMFIVMGKDLRVVIIKLFGVYYDISILRLPLSPEQLDFVKQVKEIHVPLSERLGLDKLKQGLYDNVIRLEYPEEYERLKKTIENEKEENLHQLEITKNKISEILSELKIEGEIESRIKHISSIFNKLHNKQLELEQIYDILAMRVIVNTVEECYAVMGRIHGIYKPMAGRVKDYIANPKPNGYQSLHTTIIVENEHPLEVQIRTKEMHRESEYGVYSHWLYKEKKTKQNDFDQRVSWFRQTIDNAENMSNEDFIETLKSDLYAGVLLVQTPKGKVIELPAGSTVIDFAYAIHSQIGNQCVGAKINGKLKPFSTSLKHGDIVEILTNPHSKGPSRDWLKYVKTSSARSKIKAFFKNELKEENIKLGRSMFYQALQDKGYITTQLLTDEFVEDVLKRYNVESIDELYASVGSGSLTASQLLSRFITLYNSESKTLPKLENVVHLKKNKDGVLIDGDSGMMVRFAGCCSPIEGDDIIGYISRGRGVTIHRKGCPNLAYLESERLIDAQWQVKENSTFTASIKVVAEKSDNNIGNLTNLITGLKISIKGFEAKDVGDNFVCTLIIDVKNKDELESAINSIRNMKKVTSVYRSER